MDYGTYVYGTHRAACLAGSTPIGAGFRGRIPSHPLLILVEANVQYLVHAIFDKPVVLRQGADVLGSGRLQAGDEVPAVHSGVGCIGPIAYRFQFER